MSAWRGIKRIQMLLSEMVGTYFIVLSYGLSMADVKVQDGAAAALQGPMSVGLAVLSQTYAFAHVSLAQFNPAVTMGLLLTQSISVLDAIMAMAAQVLAGLMAGFTVSRCVGSSQTRVCVVVVGIRVWSVLVGLVG